MGSAHSRDQEGPAAQNPSPPQPACGEGPCGSGGRARRAWRFAWVGVVGLPVLATGLLFTREAIERQRVQKDIDRAAAAFAAAREADARDRAPGQWRKATTRMDAAMAELRRQERRFVLLRSYPRVHVLAVSAVDAAEMATAAAAQPAKVAADEERAPNLKASSPGIPAPEDGGARAAIAAALASVDTLAQLVGRVDGCQRARTNKQIRKDLEVVKYNLATYGKECNKLQDRFARGEMVGAKREADALKALADAVSKDLESVLTKFRCR